MVNVKSILPSLDLLSEVEKDAPSLAGTLRGRYSRNVPCPFCGGRDRFNVTIGTDGIMRAFCRHCAPKGLDAIAYVMKREGLDFKGALAWWKCEDRPATQREQPKDPPIVAPAQKWQDMALAFVSECEAVLWSEAGVQALAYLRKRGLSDDTIKRFRLGFNVSRREATGEAWGIGADRKVVAHAGITIPRFILGELWAVNVRRGAGSDPKYLMVTGSKLGLAGADGLKGASVVLAFGGEFDMMLAAQHAPADVACITFGGEGHAVGELWRNMLKDAGKVLVCYDTDKAGKEGAFKWFDAHRSVRRVKVPSGKDLTEFMQGGGNVAEWIAAQVAKAQGKPAEKPAGEIQTPQPAQIEPIEQPEAPQMAQDENDLIVARVIEGYLETEGAIMPSKVAAQVLLATGWQWCDEVRERITLTIRGLVKTGRVVQLPTKALALKGEV